MTKMSSRRTGALLVAGLIALAGCSSEKGGDGSCTVVDNGDGTSTISCPDGTSTVVENRVIDVGSLTADEKAALDMRAAITTVDTTGTNPVVRLRVTDARGNGLKSLATADMKFSILKLEPGADGSNDTWVSYMATTATATTSTEGLLDRYGVATGATAADNGDGTYTYTFAKNIKSGAATTYEPAKVHRLVFLMYASGNPYAPVNATVDFVPASGSNVTGASNLTGQNDKVSGAACLECHGLFRAKAGGTGHFHAGQRYDVRVCVACHNDQRRYTSLTSTNKDGDASGVVAADGTWSGNLALVNGEAVLNLPVFIHKIHMGEELTLKGGTYQGKPKPYETTYPQDVRNCEKCHKARAGENVAKAANWKQKPTRRACGACHDATSFLSSPPNGRTPHVGGAQASDGNCSACHVPFGDRKAVVNAHEPIGLPNPDNYYVSTTMTSSTNAGWLPAAGQMPEGAISITYDVATVTTVAASGGGWNPQMKLKFKKQAAGDPAPMDVVFNSSTASSELMDNFVNSPSIYFVFTVAQDGIAAPADWNASISATVKNLWKSSGGTLTGPDGSGYYTATITNAKVPDGARMLTGAIGYTYSLSSTPPLTQINLSAFPYNSGTADITCAKGDCPGGPITLKPKMGGLIVTAPDVWKTATGHTPRRTLVSNAKCNACHEQLGVNPSFHAGQRNDAPTCAFCHTPNRTSSAWSASAKEFVHGIHAAAKREWDFRWHAEDSSSGYWDVTFPGILRNCETCHVAGSYDFSSSGPNLLLSTVAAWTSSAPKDYALPAHVTDGGVLPDWVTTVTITDRARIGDAFSTSDIKEGGVVRETCTLAAPCPADGNSLASTPIAAVCFSCHDTQLARSHYAQFGAKLYVQRSEALLAEEQCLMCHGKGKIAAIDDVHLK